MCIRLAQTTKRAKEEDARCFPMLTVLREERQECSSFVLKELQDYLHTMIATSRYGPLLFLSTILTTIFHPNGICVAFHNSSPFLRRSLASAPATSTIISSSFRKNEACFYYDSVSKNPLRSHHLQINNDESSKKIVLNKEKSLGLVVCLAVVLPLLISPSASLAADDTASTTVATAVQNLIDAVGDKDKSFEALKDVADIITDGKGVGGSLTYSKCPHVVTC